VLQLYAAIAVLHLLGNLVALHWSPFAPLHCLPCWLDGIDLHINACAL
jgi:hypothetical protein